MGKANEWVPLRTACSGGVAIKRLCLTLAALATTCAAQAADLPTKKPAAPPPAKSCFSDVLTYFDSSPADCPLRAYGLTFSATIDVGVGYETHGVPFNRIQHTGVEELVNANSNHSLFLLTPNGLSQSQAGLKAKEPLAYGWSFVGEVATGFDPYALSLANGPGAQAQNTRIPLPYQNANSDSSRAGQFDNSLGYAGVSHDTLGTLTFGRQNALTLDGVIAYDPMGAAYAFSVIGWSGRTAGAGATEDARVNTAAKYAVKVGDFRFNALAQFGGYGFDNGSNGQWQVGVGGDFFNGLSVDAYLTATKDQVSLSPFNGPLPAGAPSNALKATLSNSDSVMLLAKYKWNQFTIYGGFEHIHQTNPTDNYAGGFTSVGGEPVPAGSVNSTAYTNPLNFDVFWTGAKYAVNERLDLTAAYYLYVQHDYNTTTTATTCAPNTTAAAAGFAPLGTNSAKCLGFENAVSGLIDYRPLKRVDLYAGVLYSKVSGGLATGYLRPDNLAPTVGVRVRF